MFGNKYSKEFKEQEKFKRKEERSMVHPLLITNEPDLFIAVEDVVEWFFQSEEIAWKKVANSPFPASVESSSEYSDSVHVPDCDDTIALLGDAFLQHGKSQQEIHFYFWKLDPRRNCVKKVDEHIAITQPLKLLESGSNTRGKTVTSKRSSKKRLWTNPLSLEEKEVYKLLLKCALHPPLDEPMPSPAHRDTSRNQLANVDAVTIEHNRLIQKPIRAFCINQNLHDKLRYEVLSKLPNRDITMALNTELIDQMARLKSNECQFYQPADFANFESYERWRQQKMLFVNRLLCKWCSNRKSSLMAQIARNMNCHEAYKMIVEKFLHLDLREKDEASNQKITMKTITSILTTESRKLLNEFCMWYGIDDIYRQLAILDAMVEILSLNISDWYIECLLLAFKETMDFITERIAFLVKAEKKMAEVIFNRLVEQIKEAFIKLFYMYKKLVSGHGIDTLVLLLQYAYQAKQFFDLFRPDFGRCPRRPRKSAR